MMKFPVNYTFLGLMINSLIDRGYHMSIDELFQEDVGIFNVLKSKFNDEFDISCYSEAELIGLEKSFFSLYSAVYTSSMLVNDNGLCLLVAYCFDFIQQEYKNQRLISKSE